MSCSSCPERRKVALFAEGVDRNSKMVNLHKNYVMSPSSRRAWIEIPRAEHDPRHPAVALFAEGVDRNLVFIAIFNNTAESTLTFEQKEV